MSRKEDKPAHQVFLFPSSREVRQYSTPKDSLSVQVIFKALHTFLKTFHLKKSSFLVVAYVVVVVVCFASLFDGFFAFDDGNDETILKQPPTTLSPYLVQISPAPFLCTIILKFTRTIHTPFGSKPKLLVESKSCFCFR